MQRLILKCIPWPSVPFLFYVLGLIFCLPLASAAIVELAWNRNPEKNIAAYEISYGTQPGIYPNKIDAGNKVSASVENLDAAVTYYFVVAARNTAGSLGPRSDEVSYRPSSGPAPTPPKGSIKSPASATTTIEVGEQVNFEGRAVDPKRKNPLTYRWTFGENSGISDSMKLSPGNKRFYRPGTYEVTFTVTNALGLPDPTPAVRTIVVNTPLTQAFSRKKWKLHYVDSQEVSNYAAKNAFDGNPATFWHTQFTNVALVKEPHEIQIDMKAVKTIAGFHYLPRQDGFDIGDIGEYRFYVSMDGKNWGRPVAKGTFESSIHQKEVHFRPKKGRYLRLRSMSEANGYTDTNVAELKVLRIKKTKKKKSKPSPTSAASASSLASYGSPSSPGYGLSNSLVPKYGNHLSDVQLSITTEVFEGRKYLALTVRKTLGVRQTVLVSPDLVDWFSGSRHTTVITDNDTILKVRDNTPITRDWKRYIRLKSSD
jgi:PKD repeat protein